MFLYLFEIFGLLGNLDYFWNNSGNFNKFLGIKDMKPV